MAQDNPIDGVDLANLTPQDFSSLVKEASDKQLTEIMDDTPIRDRVLNEVFTRMGERYVGGDHVSAVIHWKILDKPGGGYDHFETVVKDGDCTVSTTPSTEPRLTISLSGPQFLKLASGNGSPTMMFFTKKIKLSGDVGFATGLAAMFDIPKAS